MAFFGLTMLGDPDVFGTAKAHKLERLANVGELRFVEEFHAMCLERTAPRLAREIQVDGTALMLRGELPTLVTRVLGKRPNEEELNAFLTFFDITASGVIDVGEFKDAIHSMMQRAREPKTRAGTRLPEKCTRTEPGTNALPWTRKAPTRNHCWRHSKSGGGPRRRKERRAAFNRLIDPWRRRTSRCERAGVCSSTLESFSKSGERRCRA